jgi:hypothetical protein
MIAANSISLALQDIHLNAWESWDRLRLGL